MSVLLGTAAAGLDASALGLTFCQIPAGPYEIGAADLGNNPLRHVGVDAFELADTPTTNGQWAQALKQLGDQKTALMFESVRDRRWAVAARGTREEIGEVTRGALMEIVSSLWLGGRVDDFAVRGALQAFDLGEEPPPVKIVPVTLEHYLKGGFDGDNQPALMRYFEAAAVAALFGLILPTGEMWEAAAGDLRDERYRDERELRRVAYFMSAGVTPEVGTREPNRYGLYDMLGNVLEAMANRYSADSEERELRGGSWFNDPENVRAAFRYNVHPDYWVYYFGCRFGRQDSKG
ncbi:MAG: SUMF1/EgtB/PvdO family nonheme iron enzyme [Deltaproteobacteria bacterium]|nr:SUMF1/EgtB/PvdO family nonheme iron enzyme [Deltaproteobacteria bacterium]MBI4223331.1 SUMF1/EgtB/PvdO family nonheme iron enzyme [Deltaproteobacteria bacterium]